MLYEPQISLFSIDLSQDFAKMPKSVDPSKKTSWEVFQYFGQKCQSHLVATPKPQYMISEKYLKMMPHPEGVISVKERRVPLTASP
jgi:hypothetical protein